MGRSYFAASALMAVKSERKLRSVSMFSSRWAERSMYLPFSSPRRWWMSLAQMASKLARSTSAIGEPVT